MNGRLALLLLTVLLTLPTRPALAQELLDCARGKSGKCVGVAIVVSPSSYVYADNPRCGQGYTDRLVRDVLMAAGAERSRFGSVNGSGYGMFWSRLKARASRRGDLVDLFSGTTNSTGGALCQAFVVPVDAPMASIRAIEFRASNDKGNGGLCFSASVSSNDRAIRPSADACPIGWSAWESATVIEDGPTSALVGAIFKNWSHNLLRRAEVWVWY